MTDRKERLNMALTREFLEGLGLTANQAEGVLNACAEDGEWQTRYEALKREYDAYRAKVEAKAKEDAVRAAYRALLKTARIDDKRVDAILRVTPLDHLTLNEDGTLADAEQLLEAIRREWADFVVTEETRGADVATPPSGGAYTPTRAEILAIRDTAQRQRAIAENHELFGF